MRADQRLAAIKHARAHLAPWAGQHMAELQRAVATLAFTSATKCAPYRWGRGGCEDCEASGAAGTW